MDQRIRSYWHDILPSRSHRGTDYASTNLTSCLKPRSIPCGSLLCELRPSGPFTVLEATTVLLVIGQKPEREFFQVEKHLGFHRFLADGVFLYSAPENSSNTSLSANLKRRAFLNPNRSPEFRT